MDDLAGVAGALEHLGVGEESIGDNEKLPAFGKTRASGFEQTLHHRKVLFMALMVWGIGDDEIDWFRGGALFKIELKLWVWGLGIAFGGIEIPCSIGSAD